MRLPQHSQGWSPEAKVAFAALLLSAFSLYFSWDANSLANKNVETSQAANRLSEEANEVAKKSFAAQTEASERSFADRVSVRGGQSSDRKPSVSITNINASPINRAAVVVTYFRNTPKDEEKSKISYMLPPLQLCAISEFRLPARPRWDISMHRIIFVDKSGKSWTRDWSVQGTGDAGLQPFQGGFDDAIIVEGQDEKVRLEQTDIIQRQPPQITRVGAC